jgi:hypothetical protein
MSVMTMVESLCMSMAPTIPTAPVPDPSSIIFNGFVVSSFEVERRWMRWFERTVAASQILPPQPTKEA